MLRPFRARAIPFLLFAPALTSLKYAIRPDVSALFISQDITYQNGAVVSTAFLTNMEPQTTARSCPDLDTSVRAALLAAGKHAATHRKAPTNYPPNLALGSHFKNASRYGINLHFTRADSKAIPALAEQKANGTSIYGGGLLLSTRATQRAEKAKTEAEKARQKAQAEATTWHLSEAEIQIIQALDQTPLPDGPDDLP